MRENVWAKDITGNDLYLETEDLQFSHFTLNLDDRRYKNVKIEYQGTEYDIEIQDGKPVVVQNG